MGEVACVGLMSLVLLSHSIFQVKCQEPTSPEHYEQVADDFKNGKYDDALNKKPWRPFDSQHIETNPYMKPNDVPNAPPASEEEMGHQTPNGLTNPVNKKNGYPRMAVDKKVGNDSDDDEDDEDDSLEKDQDLEPRDDSDESDGKAKDPDHEIIGSGSKHHGNGGSGLKEEDDDDYRKGHKYDKDDDEDDSSEEDEDEETPIVPYIVPPKLPKYKPKRIMVPLSLYLQKAARYGFTAARYPYASKYPFMYGHQRSPWTRHNRARKRGYRHGYSKK